MKIKPFDESHWDARLRNWADWSVTESGKPRSLSKTSSNRPMAIERDAMTVDGLISRVRVRNINAQVIMQALEQFYLRRLYDSAAQYRSLNSIMTGLRARAWTQQSDGLTGEQRAERLVARGLRMVAEEADRHDKRQRGEPIRPTAGQSKAGRG